MNKISLVPIYSTNILGKKIDKEINNFLDELNTLEGFSFELVNINEKTERLTVLLILGGGTEAKTLEYLRDKEDPVILLTYPYNNSLPATFEITAYLQGTGRKAFFVQTIGEWKTELQEILKIYTAGKNLKNKKIGRMGQEGKSRYPFEKSPVELIKGNWGPEVIDISFDELTTKLEKCKDDPRVSELVDEMVNGSIKSVEPDSNDIRVAVEVYLALKDVVNEYRLDAIALKCFDLLPIIKNTGCYALAKLNEEGIVASCEGDILTATGMLIIRELTGEPSFMANPSLVDVEKGLLTIAHCTIPRTMCSGYIIRSHFETGIGVAFQGTMYDDKYTLFRIGGKNLQEMYVAVTDYQGNGEDEKLCRTQLSLKFEDPRKVEELLSRPLGNHHLIVRGNHQDRLLRYYNMFVK